MRDSAWVLVLMLALAVLIAGAFIILWVRDKNRADEVSDDQERAHTDTHLGSDAREGAVDGLPPESTERRP